MEAAEYREQIADNEMFAYYYDRDGNTIEETIVEVCDEKFCDDRYALRKAKELGAHHFHTFNPNDRNMLTFYKWDAPVYGMVSKEHYLRLQK